MTTRTNRIMNMLSHKDRLRLEDLDTNLPRWETTKGTDVQQLEIDQLKKIFEQTEEHNQEKAYTNSPAISPNSFEPSDEDSEYVPSSIETYLDVSDSENKSEKLIENLNTNSHTAHTNIKQDQEKSLKFNSNGEVKSSSTNIQGKVKRDKREHCVYCEKNVTNFSRHLIRIHNEEFEVLKILSLPKGSQKRKDLFDEIRKRGNFINSFGNEGFINPVRRPKAVSQKATSDYLPCKGCKGFFTRTYLFRHMKKCHKKIPGTDSKHAQCSGLTMLYTSCDQDFEELKLNVFPHMQCDDITKIVINDFLIKYYGQRYYKCHKEKHLINTVSQRMRELARFFKTLQNQKPKFPYLVDYLKPCYFDLLIGATNEFSGYDKNKDTFKSPSLALRWATVLKQVCDVAMFISVKENNMIKNKEIKTLRQMIDTQFRFYVSTNANKDLSSKNWQKGSMLPLTDDVIKMNEFVIHEEEKWYEKLEKDPNNILYIRNLTEVILAHVILLNRKRSGEAQRITIEDYLRREDDLGVEDIFKSLTVTEKVLVKNIKRFIIRGKKGRAVPVIFTKDMQKHANLLLKSRNLVADSNPYLFANPATQNSYLWAYKVLKKVAIACNVRNIDSITSTCLRKHIATIAQLISMEDNDLEQLSNHLGHEKATHMNYYRKTNDKLQIAKVSKFLLLMEKKSMGEYRGKSIENIDLDIPDMNDEITENCNKKEKDPKNLEHESTDFDTDEMENDEEVLKNCNKKRTNQFVAKKRHYNGKEENNEPTTSYKMKEKKQERKVRILVPWTNEQKKVAKGFFKKNLVSKRAPKKNECDELKKIHSKIFNNKTWAQIKIFIVNEYKKL